MQLTGREIRGYLEHSYAGWAATSITEDGGLIRLRTGAQPTDKYKTFVPPYNYSAAQGIDYTVDLSRIIKAWEDGTGKKMAKLAYAQFLFTANGNIGYVGDFYVQKVSFGDYDYKAFDIGEAISTNAGPGVVTYSHAYSRPGTYKVVVIGSTVSKKNYGNGGYKHGYAGKVSADEYKYGKVLKTIEVTVK